MAGLFAIIRTRRHLSGPSFFKTPVTDPMYPRPCCSHQKPRAPPPIPSRWCWVSEVLEIGIGSLCSIVTWMYTVQNEVTPRQHTLSGQHLTEQRPDNFVFRPSPTLMLFSCLVFGCCVSSFAHRRQTQDPLQLLVYLVFLGCAAMIGHAARANVHLILLGYLPWATCLAMAASISGHSLYRRYKSDVGTGHADEEKTWLLG
ncbi:hypothetical protein VTI74DRAFT_8806 [Chaetomium olivicolor]